MDDAAAIQIIRAGGPDAVAFYRFGSTVAGTARRDGDVDLAVLPHRRLDAVRRFELQERLASALRCDVASSLPRRSCACK